MFDWFKSEGGTGSVGLQRMRTDFGQMLDSGRHMFDTASNAFLGGTDLEVIREDLFATDKRINRGERQIRRELVVHASVHGATEFPPCLVLMSIVKDAERVGDYGKNLFDLAELTPSVPSGEHRDCLVGLKDRWQLGRSGQKPDGTDFFSTGLEPWRNWGRNPAPGAMGLYSYFVDMKPDPSAPYYGNPFRPDSPPVLIQRGRWYCMEMMVKANTPNQADGEQAFWVDGQLKGHYTGIRWRTTDKLKINCLWVLLYIHKNKQVNRVWFDDIVVAKDYIGLMVAPAEEGSGTRDG